MFWGGWVPWDVLARGFVWVWGSDLWFWVSHFTWLFMESGELLFCLTGKQRWWNQPELLRCWSTNSVWVQIPAELRQSPNNCAWFNSKSGMEPQIWVGCVHLRDPIITERRQSYAWITLNFHQINPKFMSLSLLDAKTCSLSQHRGTHQLWGCKICFN